MIWEVVNPSDACSIEAPNLEVAACAIVALGEGRYGGTSWPEDPALGVPIFLFGGHDEWFTAHFGADFQTCLERNKAAAGLALGTLLYGKPAQRARWTQALACVSDPAERELAKAALMDVERSSMNNIAARAARIAELWRDA